jgi:F-type H+-transporting ATPase subunit b
MMKDAREIKTKMIADAKDEAQAAANKTIANAQATIQAEKKAAIADIKSQVATLSVEIAEKVVKQELSNKDKQLELVASMLKDAKLN